MDKYNLIIQTAQNIISPGSRATISPIVSETVNELLVEKYGKDWKNKEDLFLNAYAELRGKFELSTYKSNIPYFYALYYLSLNIPKLQIVLLELLKKTALKKDLKILDIGSGIGTSLLSIIDLTLILDNLSALFEFTRIFDNLSLTMVEGSKANIDVFKKIFSIYRNKTVDYFDFEKRLNIVGPIVSDIAEDSTPGINNLPAGQKFDLIIISNTLNEIQSKKRIELLKKTIRYLNSVGYLIIIEPADFGNSRQLNNLKYKIINCSELINFLPCGNYEKCQSCWSFRSTNLVSNEPIKYFDKIYANRYNIDNNDFSNNRLKWSYSVFGNTPANDNSHKNQDYSFSELDKKEWSNIDAIFQVIQEINENTYKICDRKSQKNYFLKIKDKNSSISFKHGDILHAKGLSKEKRFGGFNLLYKESSSYIVLNKYASKEKIILSNVSEKPLKFLLKRIWGFDDFREGQFEIIKKALEGKEPLGILPTGAGKSLCYQMPALISNGASIVISPLKSLIKDQVDSLKKIGFEFVDNIDGSKTIDDREKTLKRFKKGQIKLLYVAPERLQIGNFQKVVDEFRQNHTIDYFIVDEAHCASEWGHDFRPSYLMLRSVAKKMGDPVFIAVTATASKKVKEDILEIFSIDERDIITSKTMDRPEISLEVKLLKHNDNKFEVLRDVFGDNLPKILKAENIEEINKENSGLVFVPYADPSNQHTIPLGTDCVKEKIQQFGHDMKVEKYHAKLSDEDRISIQDSYKENRFPLLVATKGFGMGIDKPNIRYIIHTCFSNSLEAYYQEAGRAGRDGQHSHSVIIVRDRLDSCVKDTNNILGEPPCATSGRPYCFYSENVRCDYGVQASFISSYYLNPKNMFIEARIFLVRLKNAANNNINFSHSIPNTEDGNSATSRYQSYLFYLKKFKILRDYYVKEYRNQEIIFEILSGTNLQEINTDSIAKKITEKIQIFKQQRYEMLHLIWDYARNKVDCRRQRLLHYFGEARYDEGCNFCDIEINDFNYNFNLAGDEIPAAFQDLYDEFDNILENNIINFLAARTFLKKVTQSNIQSNIRMRAMRYLEDYPESFCASYFAGILSINNDEEDSYGKNKILYIATELLKNKNIKEFLLLFLDLIEINEDFAFEVLNLDNNIDYYKYPEIIYDCMNNAFNEANKELLYKLYINSKLAGLLDQYQHIYKINKNRS